MVAGKNGAARLGTDASVNQMLKFGSVTCVAMLILGILASGGSSGTGPSSRSCSPRPHRARIFAVRWGDRRARRDLQRRGLRSRLGTIVLELSAHGIHLHWPTSQLYAGTVISSACFGMIGVALGALTRNTIGAIVATIAWTLFIEQVILHAIVPGIEQWLPTGVAIGLTNAPGRLMSWRRRSPGWSGPLRHRLARGREPHPPPRDLT